MHAYFAYISKVVLQGSASGERLFNAIWRYTLENGNRGNCVKVDSSPSENRSNCGLVESSAEMNTYWFLQVTHSQVLFQEQLRPERC